MKVTYSKFKLYLEGKEVDFTSANINETGFSPAICTISFPANSKSIGILAGTIIQLFHDIGNGYKIIFEGEFLGKSFNKTAGQEMIQLQFKSINSTLSRAYKKPIASLTTEANNQSAFYLIDSSSKKAFNFPSPEVQAALDNYDNLLIGLKKYFEAIKESLEKEDDSLLQKAIYGIIEDAEATTEWFEYFSKAFKFQERLLVFPNKEALTAIYEQVSDIFNRVNLASLGNTATFTQILYRILSHVGYVMLQSAAPQYGDSNKKSMVFVPSSDYFAPIKCNIFFGDEVQGAGFSQSDITEPTRLTLVSSPINFLLAPKNISVRPTFFAPVLNLDKDDIVDLKIDYTEAEQLFGIIPGGVRLQGIEAAYANPGAYKTREQNNEPTQKEVESIKEAGDRSAAIIEEAGVTNHIKKIAIKKYWDAKYENRQFSITVPYNQNRMAGFSGIFIDKNMPTITGTIKSISTNISAEGSAVSSITFIKPRIVWEYNEDLFGLNEADQTPALATWFDEELFSFENIGKKVYNKILSIADTTVDKSSIFSFTSLPTYKKLEESVPTVFDQFWNKDNAHYNTARLSLVVAALKDHYYSLGMDGRQTFSDAITSRPLLSEDDYWEFLFSGFDKIDKEKPAAINNYREGDIYRDFSIEDDVVSIKTKTHDVYKPFIYKRLEAIRRF